MTTTSSTSSSATSPYAALGLATAASSNTRKSLGQQDFLQLLTAQLQNQNPMEPISNSDFLGEMAQFSTVSGIGDLNTAFSSLASQLTSGQSLQAASLVGHQVLVPSSEGLSDGSGLSGAIEVPASGPVGVQIRDGSGALVRTLDLGARSAGLASFSWDGRDAGGSALPAGVYSISATVGSSSGSAAATVDVAATVQSVALGSDGLSLQLAGLGSVAFSQVRQIL
jgi:flagellar basal-body rod modification protein FlgD